MKIKQNSQNKIYDVAGAAGVSLATVSRVLNHPEKVKPATRERIQKIIKELGYKPNLNAKGLASNKSTTVAVVVPELTRSSVASMVDGIADCATRRGYLIRLFVSNAVQKMMKEETDGELWGTLLSSGVDGILYINDEVTDEQLSILEKVDLPLVLTNSVCKSDDIPCVSIDYEKAAYDITKQMIAKGNHKIWMISTVRKYAVNDLKVAGYDKAMTEAGLNPVIKNVPGNPEMNEPIFNEMLEEDHPEVAIVVRDSMAVSFINAARLLHIGIPDDTQVIGFQNTKYAELSRPTLTCIDNPIYEIGEQAMELLTKLMDEDTKEEDLENIENVHVDYKIIWRKSTK